MTSAARSIVRDVDGVPLCVNDLPPAEFAGKWTPRRKVRVLLGIAGGLVAFDAAMSRYALSKEEIAEWAVKFTDGGLEALSARAKPCP